jgi:hypothetical protein
MYLTHRRRVDSSPLGTAPGMEAFCWGYPALHPLLARRDLTTYPGTCTVS